MINCWCLLAVVSFLCIQSSEAFGSNFFKLKKLLTEDSELQISNDGDHGEQYIEQQLDHFNPQDKATYKQRYFVNDNYFTNHDGPVFVYIGGEATLDGRRAQFGFHVKAAKKFGALIFAVEHRFYGKSLNDDGLKLENLKYLSSQQALADLAHFHKVMSDKYNLGKKNEWVCFGGSYPGSLSAWFRLKYPHLVAGAIASSAPVQALVDFQGYNNVVANSLGTEVIGGSKQCVDNIRKAFVKVDEMLDKMEFMKLGKDFKTCSPLTSDVSNMYTFASSLADLFMGIVQYNKLGRSSLNVEDVCKDMTATSDAYENLITAYLKMMVSTATPCTDISWSNFIDSLKNQEQGGNMRQWTYQTCAQFGYYQTCEENTDCIFSKYLSLGPNLEICQSVFGIKPIGVYDNVDFTNSFYGSNEPQGSNILFVNGLIDPWHALSVLNNLTTTENALVIPDTAHCADMHDDSKFDSPALTQAREVIMSKLESWLVVKPRPLKFKITDFKRKFGLRL